MKKVDEKTKSRNKLKYFYMLSIMSQVEERLDSLVLDKYLDLTLKSIVRTRLVQTSDRYILSLVKDDTTFFDLRKKCLELLFLKIKGHHNNMMIVDEKEFSLHVYK